MSSTQTRITFYVAPSKERHPLVSQLFRCIDAERIGKPRIVESVTRIEGFLTGTFEISDGNMYQYDGFDGDTDCHNQKDYEETKKFFDLYRELGALGYLSEDHRCSWWSSGGSRGSDWNDVDYDDEIEEYRRQEEKKKLKFFWQEYPNLMSIIKYGRQADGQPQSLL